MRRIVVDFASPPPDGSHNGHLASSRTSGRVDRGSLAGYGVRAWEPDLLCRAGGVRAPPGHLLLHTYPAKSMRRPLARTTYACARRFIPCTQACPSSAQLRLQVCFHERRCLATRVRLGRTGRRCRGRRGSKPVSIDVRTDSGRRRVGRRSPQRCRAGDRVQRRPFGGASVEQPALVESSFDVRTFDISSARAIRKAEANQSCRFRQGAPRQVLRPIEPSQVGIR